MSPLGHTGCEIVSTPACNLKHGYQFSEFVLFRSEMMQLSNMVQQVCWSIWRGKQGMRVVSIMKVMLAHNSWVLLTLPGHYLVSQARSPAWEFLARPFMQKVVMMSHTALYLYSAGYCSHCKDITWSARFGPLTWDFLARPFMYS